MSSVQVADSVQCDWSYFMMKGKLAKGVVLIAAIAGSVLAAPAVAVASPASHQQASVIHPMRPTGERFATYDECEARAAQIRDGITGAWCEFTFHWSAPWELHVAG
jgi:hypothetical protein